MSNLGSNFTLLLQLLSLQKGLHSSRESREKAEVSKIGWHFDESVPVFGSGCDPNVYEKDECVFDSGMMMKSASKRNALQCKRWLWPEGVVPYSLQISDPEIRDRFHAAVNELHLVTDGCVQFLSHSSSPKKKFLSIQDSPDGQSCRSTVGSTTAQPAVHLSATCSKGQIMHELMHVLGFAHEHSRPDRDAYVKIHCANILPNTTSNFRRLKSAVVSSFGQPYDFYSIMHYRLDHFSNNGKMTIEPLIQGIRRENVGRMESLSPGDIRQLRALYGCD